MNQENPDSSTQPFKRNAVSIFVGLAAIALLICAAAYLPKIASVSTSVGGRELPIYCVDTDKPQISISFDAAWGNEDTQTILDILAKHNVKATFFMTGGWVESYPEDVKKIYEAGKIEILGMAAEDEMLFKYHQAKKPEDAGRLFTRHLEDTQCWL